MTELDIGGLPEDWYVLWCPNCFCSLTWSAEIVLSLSGNQEWEETLSWAAKECTHNLELHEEVDTSNIEPEITTVVEPIVGRVIESKVMRVGDLIEKLRQFDPRMPVCTNDNEYGPRNAQESREFIPDQYEARYLGIPEGTTCVMIE